MLRLPTTITTLLAGAALLVPATASADVQLGGAITLRVVDSHHAKLEFASDKLPRASDGTIDARVTLPGRRASALKADGLHGTDTRYVSTITSKTALRENRRYTVTLAIAGQKDIVRKIKLIDSRR